MSGIGGVRVFSAGALATEALREMAELLHHRGPDESAIWVGPDVGLAHARLAIIDVERSHQPMHSVDGRWVIAFDGEIFNDASLRTQLDYPFRTRGDTEVLVAGLALEGISFVERLQGQFAFVAHDLRTDTTHLVRDRLGILPLYYRQVPGGIAFASEVKALLAVGPPPEVDHRSLDAYLGARMVPAPDTLFEGVKKVRPAHRVSILPRAHLEETRYWAPPQMDPDGTWSDGDAIEAVGDGLREAVRAALAADVPVGAHLSGGLGSSLVVAQMLQLRDAEPLHTFAAGFADHPQDELHWARKVSALLGTDHHEVRMGAHDFEDVWARLTWHRDAPIGEPADVAQFRAARAAHEHVGVVLSAVGADELFGGHPKYRHARLAERSAALPSRVRSALGGPLERHLGTSFSASERQRLVGTPPVERRTSPSLGVDPVDRMLRHDLRHVLPDDLLERTDRMTMAASIQLRPALLDHRLVELAFRLPTSVKVHGGSTTWVLKEVARQLLPDEIAGRRRTGHDVPLSSWFRTSLRDTARDRLLGADSWVAQTMDRSVVRDLVQRHERGAHEELRLWTLLSLEMWHESFFGSAPSVPRPRHGLMALPAALRLADS